MNLHLLPDEKIVNRTIEIFESVFPGKNKYLVFLNGKASKYVDNRHPNICLTQYGSNDFKKFVGETKQYDKIIIHYLSHYSIKFLNEIEHDNIYWIEWGYDLFNMLLEPRGYRIYYQDSVLDKFIYRNKIVEFVHKKLRFLFPSKAALAAIAKIKYFVPDSMYDEYPLLLKYYPQFKHLEYKEFFYYPIQQVVDNSIYNKRCYGANIIIGNSASLTGNHLEVLRILSKIDLGERLVKLPLSYGGSPDYVRFLTDQGTSLLGDRFYSLTSYLSLNEYNNFLLDASYYIYNNYRQEAVGNILVALFFGGKVFLSDNSPLLAFYKRLGLVIYAVSDLSKESLNTPMAEEDVLNNRKIIELHYSLNRLYNLVKHNFS